MIYYLNVQFSVKIILFKTDMSTKSCIFYENLSRLILKWARMRRRKMISLPFLHTFVFILNQIKWIYKIYNFLHTVSTTIANMSLVHIYIFLIFEGSERHNLCCSNYLRPTVGHPYFVHTFILWNNLIKLYKQEKFPLKIAWQSGTASQELSEVYCVSCSHYNSP